MADFNATPIVINGNACFLSDAHFQVPADERSRQREEQLIALLDSLKGNLQHLFLLGDIFDFWFEYRDVVPKGYFRLFNTLYELHKSGVQLYYFVGNHDMWVKSYLQQELGMKVFYQPQVFLLNGKKCFVGHGDGLGGHQRRYLLIKYIFAFKPNQLLYSMLHPRQAFSIARRCSSASRSSHKPEERTLRGEQEHQVMFARELLQTHPVDFFIFAHRHVPSRYELDESAVLFNCGDWLDSFSYLLFNEGNNEPSLLFLTHNGAEKGINE